MWFPPVIYNYNNFENINYDSVQKVSSINNQNINTAFYNEKQRSEDLLNLSNNKVDINNNEIIERKNETETEKSNLKSQIVTTSFGNKTSEQTTLKLPFIPTELLLKLKIKDN